MIRRGFDNVVANWPLLLIRVGESLAVMIVVFATFVAAIVPVVVTIFRGSRVDFEHPDDVAQLVIHLITEHAMLIAYLVVLATLLLTLILAIRSFIEAGSARILFDGEAAKETSGSFAAFDVQRWFDGGKASWWPVFLIYNVVGCVAIVAALVPVGICVGLFAIGGPDTALVGCVVVPLMMIAILAITVVVVLWNQKAIVVCVQRGLGAMAALRVAWHALMEDFSRHLGAGVLIALITFGAAMLLSVMSLAAGFGRHADVAMAFAPMQIIGSFAQSAVSAVASTWFVACFVALTVDNRR